MKAMQVNKASQGPRLIFVELPRPEVGLGEISVHVHALVSLLQNCFGYPTTHAKSKTPRMRAVPGHEFLEVITAIVKDVEDFEIGDEVCGGA